MGKLRSQLRGHGLGNAAQLTPLGSEAGTPRGHNPQQGALERSAAARAAEALNPARGMPRRNSSAVRDQAHSASLPALLQPPKAKRKASTLPSVASATALYATTALHKSETNTWGTSSAYAAPRERTGLAPPTTAVPRPAAVLHRLRRPLVIMVSRCNGPPSSLRP